METALRLAGRLRQALPLAFCGYVLAVVVLHLVLPAAWTLPIAYGALIGMLFTYPAHAVLDRRDERLELAVSLGFAAVGLFGLVFAPLVLVAAIAAHGVLDLLKHAGLGVRVPVWYLWSCAAFDFGYAAFLVTRL